MKAENWTLGEDDQKHNHAGVLLVVVEVSIATKGARDGF